jgi:hypothetical protein
MAGRHLALVMVLMMALAMALDLAIVGTAVAAEPPVEPLKATAGRIESVTLYIGQALVTRVVPLDAPAGRVEILVTDLPEFIEPESLFAESGEGVSVRAVRYRTRAVGEDPREAVRKLDADIEAANDRLARNRRLQQLAQQRLAYLDKQENFVAPTASVEMARGVLNADALRAVSLFNFDQRKAAAEEQLKLDAEARDIGKEIELLGRKRAEAAARGSRQVREALLFLEKTAPGRASVRLSYLVEGAGWSPAYNFRAEKEGRGGTGTNGVSMRVMTRGCAAVVLPSERGCFPEGRGHSMTCPYLPHTGYARIKRPALSSTFGAGIGLNPSLRGDNYGMVGAIA